LVEPGWSWEGRLVAAEAEACCSATWLCGKVVVVVVVRFG